MKVDTDAKTYVVVAIKGNNQKYFSFDVISSKWQKDFIFYFYFIFYFFRFLICARCFVFKFQCHLHGSFQIFFSFWVGPHFSPPYIRCSRIWEKLSLIHQKLFFSFDEKCVDPARTVHRKMYGIDKKCISRFFFFFCVRLSSYSIPLHLSVDPNPSYCL